MRTVHCADAGIRHDHTALAVAAGEAVADAILLREFAAENEVAAVARKTGAARQRNMAAVAVPFLLTPCRPRCLKVLSAAFTTPARVGAVLR
jgi:hypothetical protein